MTNQKELNAGFNLKRQTDQIYEYPYPN